MFPFAVLDFPLAWNRHEVWNCCSLVRDAELAKNLAGLLEQDCEANLFLPLAERQKKWVQFSASENKTYIAVLCDNNYLGQLVLTLLIYRTKKNEILQREHLKNFIYIGSWAHTGNLPLGEPLLPVYKLGSSGAHFQWVLKAKKLTQRIQYLCCTCGEFTWDYSSLILWTEHP